MNNESSELFKLLKEEGFYPYSDLDREPVVWLLTDVKYLEKFYTSRPASSWECLKENSYNLRRDQNWQVIWEGKQQKQLI